VHKEGSKSLSVSYFHQPHQDRAVKNLQWLIGGQANLSGVQASGRPFTEIANPNNSKYGAVYQI
jgi:hypothetical protein